MTKTYTEDLSNWLIVVPARLQSSRLVEKPLQDLGGKPLIVRVAENLNPLRELGATVVVATDSTKIAETCKKFGIIAEMTDTNHRSGSDRCQEVATKHSQKFVLNVQGDEPFLNLDDLLNLIKQFPDSDQAKIGTLVFRSTSQDDFLDPACVKAIVCEQSSYALYFTRAAAPYQRNLEELEFFHHLGVYAYHKESLQQFCKLKQSKLELSEKLEQLRALENNMPILAVEASHQAIGIDTPEDLEAARARL